MSQGDGQAKVVDAYIRRTCAPLQGGKIIAAGADDEGFPFLLVQCRDGNERVLVAARDPEVNGPGEFLVSDTGL
jgi:hypothetical protein